ncbi:MAG: phosphate ABC transporter ATP-binding protein [Proteobacteria bacterium]|nr:phosphate ABC transporter ATP-binding protein [Pseudomonadota bacterium]
MKDTNSKSCIIKTKNLSFYYNQKQVLKEISVEIPEKSIFAVIGSSGQGKSTLLKIFNRLWETIPYTRMEGDVHIRLKGEWINIYDKSVPLPELRRSVGMIFQTPNPLPMSIYKNVAFPLKLSGYKDKLHINKKVEDVLKRVYLWKEVNDRLEDDARSLSGGQQQRLCIARALVFEPEILLVDEPTSFLDVKSSRKIETLLQELKDRCTILLVSHSMEQIKRIADITMELSTE